MAHKQNLLALATVVCKTIILGNAICKHGGFCCASLATEQLSKVTASYVTQKLTPRAHNYNIHSYMREGINHCALCKLSVATYH